MLIPAEDTLQIVENAGDTAAYLISGITDATGYSAAVDIRDADRPDGDLIIGFTSPSSGITLSASADGLLVTIRITAAERDTIIAGYNVHQGKLWWSLKIIEPGGVPLQYIKGAVQPIRTATP